MATHALSNFLGGNKGFENACYVCPPGSEGLPHPEKCLLCGCGPILLTMDYLSWLSISARLGGLEVLRFSG